MLLNTHSYFSLRYGTMEPRALLQIAQQKGIDTLALTDINSTSACLDFVRMSSKHEIRPVLGVDFRNGAKQQFIVLAKNNQGFHHINSYLSSFLSAKAPPVPAQAKTLDETFVIYPFLKCRHFNLKKNEFLGVRVHELNQLKFSNECPDFGKLVVLHSASFRNKRDFNAHRLLRAIDHNTLLSKLEVEEQGSERDILLTEDELIGQFKEWPELIENTQKLLKQCSISFDFESKTPKNQKNFTKSNTEDFALLETLCREGLAYRYAQPDEKILARIEKELKIIREKNFVSYFLINWEIVSYARKKGYFYVGRGSGANSVVAYLLRITDVDPIELDLYFERFINLYRQNPPDFDLDFSWADRDDVIDFIFERFPHTALITVYNTFQYKASVRELGKVFWAT